MTSEREEKKRKREFSEIEARTARKKRELHKIEAKIEEKGKELSMLESEIEAKKRELYELADCLFEPVDKNPYYLRGRGREAPIPIKNLHELKDMLDLFGTEHAPWLASWIEYLGDKETADRIRETPEKFKEIISVRYDKLKGVHSRGV
jgi:hypothetical protein